MTKPANDVTVCDVLQAAIQAVRYHALGATLEVRNADRDGREPVVTEDHAALAMLAEVVSALAEPGSGTELVRLELERAALITGGR